MMTHQDENYQVNLIDIPHEGKSSVKKLFYRFDANDLLSIIGMMILCSALASFDWRLALAAVGTYLVIVGLIGAAKN